MTKVPLHRIWGPTLSFPNHIAGLDGVRAVAVIGVIAHHLDVPGSALGWSGVNLFFVLSGFLITGILLEDKGSQGYYSRFYTRRSLRIFPIYYLTIGILALAAIIDRRTLSDWPYFVSYTQNWLYAFSPTWADDGVVHFPWGASHTWTLAVEEQFYLLWPLAVACLGRRHLLYLVLAIILVGNLSRPLAVMLTERWWTGYTPLTSQMDMLAWGALGAIVFSGKHLSWETLGWLAKVIVGIGVIALAFLWIWFGSGFLASPKWLLLSREGKVLFAALGPFYLGLIVLAMSFAPLTKALELSPMKYCGRISYGLYLYHWPILVAAYAWLDINLTSKLIIAAATLLAASASYHFIERPILRYKDRIAPRYARPSHQGH